MILWRFLKRCVCSFKSAYTSKVSKELSSGNEFKHQIEIPRILAKPFEIHNKGVVQIAKNGVFVNNVINLLESNDFGFFETLEGDVFIGLFITGKSNSAKGS